MSARATPRVDLDVTKGRLEHLGLEYAADHLSELVAAAVKEETPPHRFLDELLEAEITRREERRIRTALRLSGLPTGQTLASFDFAFQPSVSRSQIETLATCSWLREHATVLLQGPPGVGKTHLAVSLGVKAVENGFSVHFLALDELLHQLKRDADVAPQRLRRKKYMNVSLLIIDEMGFQPLDRHEATLFFRLVSARYGRGSILITTNKSVKDWPEIIAGDEVMTVALLDRLLHRCHVLNISGRSYRLRDIERLLQ